MKRLLHILVAAAALVCGALSSDRGLAIDIILVWDDLDENPDFDPNGTRLMEVANAAAQIWERLIPSPGTHHVDVSWSILDEGERGYWKLDPFGNNNIYFDSDRDWFIDPTPSEHEEFDFGGPFLSSSVQGSFLYGTTSGAGNWFDGTTPPGTLEIGFVGLPKSTAPASASKDPDLLSVILHELGHDLGVGGDIFSGRYPIYPQHISGLRDVEVIESNKPDENGYTEEHGHMAPTMALMSQTVGNGKRTLPSALDVIVAARDSNYTSVDLQRKFVGIGTNWNSPGTWIGGRVPDSTDDAFVVHGGTVTLSGTSRADNLFIGRNSIIETGAQSLTVDKLLALEGGGDILRVETGGSVTTAKIQAPSFSRIQMAGGTLDTTDDGSSIGGEMVGRGTVDFGGRVLVVGKIEAAGGTLTLSGPGPINLLRTGEPEGGRMIAKTGDLKLGVPLLDFSGAIDVYPGRRLIFTRDLAVPGGVEVGLMGSPSQPGVITSEGADTDVTISDLRVRFLQAGEVVARAVTLDGSVHLEDGGRLTLASTLRTTFQGATVDGAGTLRQEGDWSVSGGTTVIDASILEWGNSTLSQSNGLALNPNSTLHITSPTISAFRGALTVDSAVLEVESPWQLASETTAAAGGSLALINSGATPTVRGAPLIARNWLVTSGGNTRIESDLSIMSTATTVVFGGSRLFLDGSTTIFGGTVSGLGDLVQSGDIDITANTTIATETFAWGNSSSLNRHTLSVQPLATLTVNSPGTGDPDNQFRGTIRLNGGTLVVNTDGPWRLPAQELLQVGGLLELDANIVTPRVQGQALMVEGRINVVGGPAHLDNDVVFLSTHQTDIAAGATLHVNGATTYQGGTFTGEGTLQHNGTASLASSRPLVANRFVQNNRITVLNPNNVAAIHANTIDFQPPSVTRLFADLHLRGDVVVHQGATFEGGGTLVIDPTGSLAGGGDLGVRLDNQGTLSPGFSPGTLQVTGNYTQYPSAALEIELAGGMPGEWDILAVKGAASLEGTLSVALLDGFTPVVGDRFPIVTAETGIFRDFSQTIFPSLPAGMTWALEYERNSVTLSTIAGLQGDLDGDKDVDRSDASVLVAHLATGAATLNDLHLLQSHFAQRLTTRGAAAPSAAVPEPASWALAGLGLVCAVRVTATRRGARLRVANSAARSPLGRG
jgi:hypothetical protein